MNAQQTWDAAVETAERLVALQPLITLVCENPIEAALMIAQQDKKITELTNELNKLKGQTNELDRIT